MAKAVLTTKPQPSYDDVRELRYQFPRTYLNQIREAVGDWIVYYEPRREDENPNGRGGRQAYIAVARIAAVEPEVNKPGLYRAVIEDYIDFVRPVPFREGGRHRESALRRPDGATNRGAFGRSVRLLPDAEFELIVQAGMGPIVGQPPARVAGWVNGTSDQEVDDSRTRSPVLRLDRDEAFRKSVRDAYGMTCAFTGLRIVNGGGIPEVEAAHIRPVAERGPDSVRNGIALCRTAHWLFDRNLITLVIAPTDDYRIRVAPDLVSNDVLRMLRLDQPIHVPTDPNSRPHPVFLRHHQDRFEAKLRGRG